MTIPIDPPISEQGQLRPRPTHRELWELFDAYSDFYGEEKVMTSGNFIAAVEKLLCGEGAAMTETATITVPRIRDGDGQPTCCFWQHHCPFLMTSGFGTREHCYWQDGRSTYRPLLMRRENGSGTTIPHADCPVWQGA